MRSEIRFAKTTGAVCALGLALVACNAAERSEKEATMSQPDKSVPAAASSRLEGPTWVLIAYGDPADPSPALADHAVTATFDPAEQRLTGNASCNRYFAHYDVDGGRLTVDGAGSTRKACADPDVNAQEQAYLAAIGAAESFSIADGLLRIAYAGGGQLTYRQQAATPLEGTRWVVSGYNNGKGGVVSVISGTELTAVFADGAVAGSAGCNHYRASYERDDARLSIGPAAGTKKMCGSPAGIMAQEAQYLSALATAAVYRIDGDTLELRRDDGALAVAFTAAAE